MRLDVVDATAPVDHRPLSHAVAEWVASQVVSGELPPGTRLQETRVAAGAGVSRSPVREAFRILERDGLVEMRPRLGAHVAPVDRDDALAVFECRRLIEPQYFRLTVESLGEDDRAELDALSRSIEQAAAAGDAALFLRRRIRYSREILMRCPNPVLRDLVDLLWNRSLRYWSLLMRLPRYPSASLERHLALHSAVMSGDGAAAERTARSVLDGSRRDVLESLSHTG